MSKLKKFLVFRIKKNSLSFSGFPGSRVVSTLFLGLYQIWLFQIRLRPEDFLGSQNNTSGERLLMASAVLSTVIKRQYSSVLPLLRHYLPVLDEICGTTTDFYHRVSIASYANRWYSQRRNVRLSVRPSVCVVSKRRQIASWFLQHPRARSF